MTTATMVAILILVSIFTVVTGQSRVLAASPTVSVNLINYGGDSTAIDNTIINAHPAFIVDNSPAGPWKGNANISTFMSAGIKYFEYLDGGYEGTEAQAIPNDITSNLNYITAAANAGAYGIFLDEVSENPSSASLSYLQQIYNKAHSLGLKVVFNTGVDSWSDSLMSYCDYINSSEVWNNAPLTASQTKWASRTWLLTQGVNDATTAANLTKAAWAKGILAEYACSSYGSIPSWLPTYYSLISGSSPVVTAPAITTTSLSNGTMGTAYSQTLTASGGTAPYTWAITSGTLPAGLTMSTTGVISGTPTTSGTSSFTIKVTDSASATATQSLTVAVNNATISVTTTTLANGTVGTVYSQTLTATGGTKPYTWTVSAGTLPTGLTLSTGGVISGTPTTVVTKALTFKVTDSNSTTATKPLTIAVNSAAININTTSLSNGTVGTAYSQTLTASGGTALYTWSITSGTLPAGLTLSSGGVISGMPSASCSATTVLCQVTDSLSNTAAQSLSITINNQAPSINTTSLSNGTVGTAYSQTLTASGGTAPYTWSITAGTLPAGLTMSTAGVISGTPTASCGATTATCQATDSLNITATRSLSITVNAIVTTPPPTPTTGNTTGVVAGKPAASGGANEYNLYLKISSTTATGLAAGQQVWCAASTTDFPSLLTVGATLTGNLDNSQGWWTFKAAAVTAPPAVIAPTITTGNAAAVTSSGATLNGSLASPGSATAVTVSFDWGLTTAYDSTTTAQTLTAAGSFGAALTGLAPNTTYHFRVKANGSSTVYGSDSTFTTAANTVVTINGNTTGVVVSKPSASGAANEYCFYLKITSTTVSGLTAGQQVWCAATTTSFPNLLTVGSTISGTLDKSAGWWVIK
jgi:Putative Ig domain